MLNLLRSSLLSRRRGVAHAFTTRAGGVSTGSLASLNLARRPHEDDAHLVENWRRVVSALGCELDGLAIASQVHGRDVAVVSSGRGPLDVVGEVDALVTTTPGVVVAMRAADCVPVLIAADGGVAAVHSGWRGTAANVVAAAVEALARETGASPASFTAAVGPHISGGAYEVGAEVVDGLTAAGLDPEVFLRGDPQGQPRVDLGAAIVSQLRSAGVGELDWPGEQRCTLRDPDLFSHRADPQAGRHAGVIALRPG